MQGIASEDFDGNDGEEFEYNPVGAGEHTSDGKVANTFFG